MDLSLELFEEKGKKKVVEKPASSLFAYVSFTIKKKRVVGKPSALSVLITQTKLKPH